MQKSKRSPKNLNFMKLSLLLESTSSYKIYGNKNTEVTSITDDSRKAQKKGLFVAIKGLTVDGHKFIPQVIEKGISVIVGEKSRESLKVPRKITYVRVEDSRNALGFLASAFFGYPSRNLKVIGVTGTDGKTTTVSLIYHLLKRSGKKVGLISTVSAKIGKKEIDTGLHVTNPDPVSLHSLLNDMVKEKCELAVVEVTSHGLDQGRVTGVEFDSAVLTNITHEHLDYHKTFEAYQDAKAKLFTLAKTFAVLNKDDTSFEYLASKIPQNVKLTTYGLNSRQVDLYGQNIHEADSKTLFEVVYEVNAYSFESQLLGNYNVSNILAALTCCKEYGVDIEKAKKAVLTFEAPIGRMEKIKEAKNFDVYVDFAHTPNSLESVLSVFRNKLETEKLGKLIVIFGCAGERDVEKRPMMGEIATRLADISIFTAEDPRSEDINKIINEMEKGAKKSQAKEISVKRYHDSNHGNRSHIFFRIPERGEAISFAIQKLAKKGDIVVICGKGHEQSMAYNGVEYFWSDHEAVKIALKGGVKEIKRPGP